MRTGSAPGSCRCCGAALRAGDANCWLCFTPTGTALPRPVSTGRGTVADAVPTSGQRAVQPPAAEATAVPAAAGSLGKTPLQSNPFEISGQYAESGTSGSAVRVLITCLLLFMLVGVGLVLYQASPGIAILYGLLMIPPLVRTMIVTMQRESKGKSVEGGQRIELFLTSVAVTAGLVLLWCVSAVVGFVVLCFGVLASGANSSDPFAIILPAAGFAVLAGLFLTGKLIAARYRRDVDRD